MTSSPPSTPPAMTPARLEQLAAGMVVYDAGLRPGQTFTPPDLAEVARALAWAAAEIGRGELGNE